MVQQFNVVQLLTELDENIDLAQCHEYIDPSDTALVALSTVTLTEGLPPADPRSQYPASKDAKRGSLAGLVARGTSEFIRRGLSRLIRTIYRRDSFSHLRTWADPNPCTRPDSK